MSKTSRKAVAIKAGLGAYLMPVLAADAAIDLPKLIGLPKAATIDADATRIANAIIAANPKLAGDAKLVVADLVKVIKLAADGESDKEIPAKDEDEDEEEEDDKGKQKPAADEDDEKDDKEKVDKTAMDAAIAQARKDTEAATVKRMNEIRAAEKEVHPLIGDIVAQDSAEAVYKLALDHLKIDVTDVHPSAYRALVVQAKAHAATPVKPRIAQDSAIQPGGIDKAFNLPTGRR